MENIKENIESRPLQELTLGDLLPYFRKLITEEVKAQKNSIPLTFSGIEDGITEKILKEPARYTYGLAGFAEVLHCSVRTAQTYKKSGHYDKAITKFGNKLVIDRVKVLEIAQQLGRNTHNREQ